MNEVEVRALKEKKLKLLRQRYQYEEDNKLEFFSLIDDGLRARHNDCCKLGRGANSRQKELLEAWDNPKYKVFTLTGANRIGKTTILAVIAISYMIGKWLWSGQSLNLSHKLPRKIRYIGQDWEEHIKTVVEPALEKWFPKNRKVNKKKNNQGIDATWVDEQTGSELLIMSNKQDSGTHEGWEGDLVLYDEPPKREIRIANARGLIDRAGRELFGMTLLKEAWIHREVIKALTKEGLPDDTVFNIIGDIEDNIGYGLTKEGVEQFAKTLKPDEIEARLRGKPAYLSGLIFPKFQRQMHVKEKFVIPLDWIVDIAIDWHPSKGWAILFTATDGINRKWAFDEIFVKDNFKNIVEEIVRRIKFQQLRVEHIIIDPLAKSGSQSDIDEQTVFDKLTDLFFQYGYNMTTASKDQNSGIDLINEFLLTQSQEPALFVFRTCPITIQHMEDWMWVEGKPATEGEDMCENLYRIMLLDTQYFAPISTKRSEVKPLNWKTV